MELVASARSSGETAPQTRNGQMTSRETLRTGVITFIARRQRPPDHTGPLETRERGPTPSLPLNPAVLRPAHMRGPFPVGSFEWNRTDFPTPVCRAAWSPGGSNRRGPPLLEQRRDSALSGVWSAWEIPNRPTGSDPRFSSRWGLNRSSWILTHGVKGNELTACRFINGIHSKIHQLGKFLGRGLRRGC